MTAFLVCIENVFFFFKILQKILYHLRHGHWLENKTIDDTTRTIPLTLITIEATGCRDQWKYAIGLEELQDYLNCLGCLFLVIVFYIIQFVQIYCSVCCHFWSLIQTFFKISVANIEVTLPKHPGTYSAHWVKCFSVLCSYSQTRDRTSNLAQEICL